MTDFSRLPKVELHLHLDCSLSYEVVRRIRPEVARERYEREFIAPDRCGSLVEYLKRAPSGIALMQTEDELGLVAEDMVRQLAEDNIIYAEVRFAPLLHMDKGLTPERVVESVNAATEASAKGTGIEVRLILCTLRHYSASQSLATAKLVERFRGSLVVALDIAGDEAGFPLAPHIAAFRYAEEKGLARTAHAGEACGPASVWETLGGLHPMRIGHGVRSIEDPALVEELKRSGTLLEVCPTSNVQTNVCDDYSSHPLPRLVAAGVRCGVNTDSRTITHISLTREYEKLAGSFGWGPKELLARNLEAIDAAFCAPETKALIRRRLTAAYPA